MTNIDRVYMDDVFEVSGLDLGQCYKIRGGMAFRVVDRIPGGYKVMTLQDHRIDIMKDDLAGVILDRVSNQDWNRFVQVTAFCDFLGRGRKPLYQWERELMMAIVQQRRVPDGGITRSTNQE